MSIIYEATIITSALLLTLLAYRLKNKANPPTPQPKPKPRHFGRSIRKKRMLRKRKGI